MSALVAALACAGAPGFPRIATVPDQPFAEVNATHAAFRAADDSFRAYARALAAVAPVYDPATPPGPPFDMFFHLEGLHRGLATAQAWLDDAEASWRDLGFQAQSSV